MTPLLAALHNGKLRGARALCEGEELSKLPWELEAWWANMVRMGREMGADFGRGLLNAAGRAHIKNEKLRPSAFLLITNGL